MGGQLVFIHYKGWDVKYNEWINIDSYRIAPLHTMTKANAENNSPSKPKSNAQHIKTQTSVNPTVKSPKTKNNKSNKYKIKRKQIKRSNSDNRTSSDSIPLATNHGVTILDESESEIK